MSRRPAVAAFAILLAVLSFVYRYNALGGAFGGFDNDHFIYLVQARQMLHGELPLRDFADAGLQGAWPWPHYAISLAGQRWLEPTLWPEGLIGSAGIAAAVAVTFVAAAAVAPAWAAAAVSVLALFIGTKLYNYPRLVVLAIAVALMIWYARAPSARRAAVIGAWGAVAFLFRHDFAVYTGIGALVLFIATPVEAGALSHTGVRPVAHEPRRHRGMEIPLVPGFLRAFVSPWFVAARSVRRVLDRRGTWRISAAHAAVSAAVAAVLLVPPLVMVERERGLVRYFSAAAEMSARERQRTTLRFPEFDWSQPGGPSTSALGPLQMFGHEQNAVALLFYVVWAVPALALLAAPFIRRQRPLVIALAVMALAVDYSFLRGNLGARLGDLGAPLAVLAAMLLALPFSAGRTAPPYETAWTAPPHGMLGWVRRGAGAAVALVALLATTASVFTVGSVITELDTTGLSDSVGKIRRRYDAATRALRALPGDGPDAVRIPAAAAYLRHCTRPEHRVMIAGSDAAAIVLADRRFAGGHSTFTQGYYGSNADQQETVDRMRKQVVPVVIAEEGDLYDRNFAVSFPIVYAYLQQTYQQAGFVGDDDERRQVLVQRSLIGPDQGPAKAGPYRCFGR